MKTPKISRTQTVKDFLKQKEKIARENMIRKQEEKFQAYLSQTAKSLLPSGFKVKLSVIDADTFSHQSAVISATSEVMGKSSVWAPWSPMAKG